MEILVICGIIILFFLLGLIIGFFIPYIIKNYFNVFEKYTNEINDLKVQLETRKGNEEVAPINVLKEKEIIDEWLNGGDKDE